MAAKKSVPSASASAPAAVATTDGVSADGVIVSEVVGGDISIVPIDGGVHTTDAKSVDPLLVDQIEENITKMFLIVKDTVSQIKALKKEWTKLSKSGKGKQRKNVLANGAPRPPSGFAKLTKLTDDLCNFLELPIGSELARTTVTKQLNGYIMKNNLQKAENKKFILPDEPLKKLLNIGDNVELSYFNLQKYMKHLYL